MMDEILSVADMLADACDDLLSGKTTDLYDLQMAWYEYKKLRKEYSSEEN